MTKTCSVSERIKVWEGYQQPIDQDAIKIAFLRKVSRRNPPFNIKVRLAPRSTVRVSFIKLYLDRFLNYSSVKF